jgi:hypothetical protein
MSNLPPGIREHHGRFQVRYYDQDGKRQAQHFARITDAKAFKRGVDADRDRDVLVDPRRGPREAVGLRSRVARDQGQCQGQDAHQRRGPAS